MGELILKKKKKYQNPKPKKIPKEPALKMTVKKWEDVHMGNATEETRGALFLVRNSLG